MGGKGIGTREEKAEEDRQNDRGKIIQTPIPVVLSSRRISVVNGRELRVGVVGLGVRGQHAYHDRYGGGE